MLLTDISEKIRHHSRALEAWFTERAQSTPHPFFLSCDIRHSGDKIAVVDANLFPAGFNNLCETYTAQAVQAAKALLNERFPAVRRVLLLSEAHTRNKFYFENIWHLATILERTGLSVRIGMIDPPFSDPLLVQFGDDKHIYIYPITSATISHHKIIWADFEPELIISNNDFSAPLPPQWQELAQPIIPSPLLGWQYRRKSAHFAFARTLIHDFSEIIGISPRVLMCRFEAVSNIDLNQDQGLHTLAQKADILLAALKQDYSQDKIERDPYLFLKSDSGTYGIGMTTVHSASELEQINRKTRNKLLSSKGGAPTAHFILQEGLPTIDFYSEQPIEPVIYLIDGRFVGGFFRLNPLRDAYSSLNSTGMQFSCLCLHKLDEPHEWPFIQCDQKQELVFVSIYLARIASLAAGMEAK